MNNGSSEKEQLKNVSSEKEKLKNDETEKETSGKGQIRKGNVWKRTNLKRKHLVTGISEKETSEKYKLAKDKNEM